MSENSKFGFVKKIRKTLDRIGLFLPLPNVEPSILSGLSVILSLGFLLVFRAFPPFSLLFLLSVLILDWLDGLVARKFGRASEEGYFVDLTSDRLSEGIIFAMFPPWFCLFTINCILSIVSVVKKRHVILPLRHLFLLYTAWLILA